MNYNSVFHVLSSLLLTVRLPVSIADDCQEVVLINQLNNFFHFDHNIFVLDSSIDRNNYIGTPLNPDAGDGNYTPQSVYSFKVVNDSITGLESLKQIGSKNTFLIVFIGNSKMEHFVPLFYHVKSIQRLNVRMKIGMFFSQIELIENLEELFYWYWTQRILYIFGAFYVRHDMHLQSEPVMNVYKFNPFGRFRLINVTKSTDIGSYFPDQLLNFQRHPLRVPDIRVQILDYDTKLWNTVINTLNASVKVIEVQKGGEGLQLYAYDGIDLIPQLQDVSKAAGAQILIYPMGMDEMVIVVPQASYFSDFMAYFMRMTSDDLFGYFFVTIAAVTLLLTVSRRFKTKKVSFFQCSADVLNLLMNDNASIKYHQLYRADVCLIVPLTFAGFIIVNGVLSIFQSYVTLPVNQPEINTIEDLYKSTVPILSPDNEWTNKVTKLLKQVSGHDGWNDKIVLARLQEINEQVSLFNTSVSFFTLKSAAKILLEVQKRLDIAGYHVPSQIYLFKTYLTYSVNDSFPFIERINGIVHSLRQAGLVYKWTDDHDEKTVQILIKRHWRSDENRNNDIFCVPTVVLYGWFASVIVFIGEVVWEKYNLGKVVATLYNWMNIG